MALIFFGLLVLFDVLAHFAEENKPHAKTLERIGLVCFAVAVFAEGLGYLYGQRNDSLSERTIVTLSELAGTADTKARQALGVSSAAMTQSSKAVDASGKATTSASNALGMAREARQEADSFEKDIVSAKKQATEAEAHLAEALQRAASAESTARKVQQDEAPRRLSEPQKVELVRLLSAAPPFTVGFMNPSSNGTPESFNFTDDLRDVFVRMKLIPAGGPATGRGTINLAPSPAHGVVIGVKSTTEFPRAAIVLLNESRSMGFESTAEAAPALNLRPDEMRILVGTKQ